MKINLPRNSSTEAAEQEEEVRTVLLNLLRLIAAEVVAQLQPRDDAAEPARRGPAETARDTANQGLALSAKDGIGCRSNAAS